MPVRLVSCAPYGSGQPLRLALLIAGVCLLLAVAARPVEAQPVSFSSADAPLRAQEASGHDPSVALRRALMLPGWGQYYNRQYYKIPIVYAALGGLVYSVIRLDAQYQRYNCAFQYKAWEEEIARGTVETNPKAGCIDEYEAIAQGRDIASNRLEPFRDNFRRNRDLSAIGIGLVYGLSVLDAYVSAHLLDFDVGEDLTVTVWPHPQGLSATVRF